MKICSSYYCPVGMLIFYLIGVLLFGRSLQLCCYPDRWEGYERGSVMVFAPHGPYTVSYEYQLKIDHVRHLMIAEGTNTMNGRQERIKLIRDYQSNVSYTLHVDSTICDRAPLTSSEHTCLGRSDGAVKLSDTYLGGAGMENVNITLYRTTDNGYNTTIAVNDNCIPVGETYHGKTTDGELLVGDWVFYNIRTDLTDFAHFGIPVQCLTGGTGTSSASIVGRRSLVY